MSEMEPKEHNEPSFPILDPYELGEELHDLRGELPENLQHIREQLTDNDIVIHIETPDIKKPCLKPSVLREIMRLSGAVEEVKDEAGKTKMLFKPHEIGHHGAPIAGLSSIENLDVDALRKFEVAHGRDALEMALKVRKYYPELLHATIIDLAQTQGLEQEEFVPGMPFGQEEPGRIILLDRKPNQDDLIREKFRRRLNWEFPFYGSVDATPTFVSAIARYAEHAESQEDNSLPAFLAEAYQCKDGREHTVGEALERSVSWVLQRLEANTDGLLEFYNPDEDGKGMASQTWKDSPFAYMHADGSRANFESGIASVEVQAFAYDALLDAAEIYQGTDRQEEALALRDRAEQLRKTIFDTYWVEHPKKGGFFALATDRDENGRLRTLDVRSSNMGRLLNSRLLESDEPYVRYMRDQTVRQLFTPEMLAAAGIRTLASDEAAYRPNSYHSGPVWWWDTEQVADGLERHNFHRLAWEVLRQRGWNTMETTGQFPEFVSGDDYEIRTNPSEVYVYNKQFKVLHLFEQPPQQIQGWSVTAMLKNKKEYNEYLRKKDSLPSSPLEQEILATLAA